MMLRPGELGAQPEHLVLQEARVAREHWHRMSGHEPVAPLCRVGPPAKEGRSMGARMKLMGGGWGQFVWLCRLGWPEIM